MFPGSLVVKLVVKVNFAEQGAHASSSTCATREDLLLLPLTFTFFKGGNQSQKRFVSTTLP